MRQAFSFEPGSVQPDSHEIDRLIVFSYTGYNNGRRIRMNLPIISNKLQCFIDALAEGHGVTQAGKIAGYTTPYRDALPFALAPAVRQMCRKHIRGKIDVEASPAAYRFLMSVLHDDKARRSERIEVAKYLLSHSVAAPKAMEEAADNDKEPHEMTDEELNALIKRTDAELMQRGQLIDATPSYGIDDVI